jgi:hypothetical protein
MIIEISDLLLILHHYTSIIFPLTPLFFLELFVDVVEIDESVVSIVSSLVNINFGSIFNLQL